MLMILLIARRDKCDLIFGRQLLSCFVSLPQSFQKGGPTIALRSSAVSFARERRKSKTRMKQNDLCFFVLWQVYQKLFLFFLLLEEGIRFFEHLTLQLYTDGQFPSLHQTPQALDARLHTLLYKRKENKKKNMKIKVIAIDSCTACITFCTEKPSTIFFFFFFTHKHQQWMIRIHSQYNNSPCWVTQTKTRETRENNPTLVTA